VFRYRAAVNWRQTTRAETGRPHFVAEPSSPSGGAKTRQPAALATAPSSLALQAEHPPHAGEAFELVLAGVVKQEF